MNDSDRVLVAIIVGAAILSFIMIAVVRAFYGG